MAECINQWQKSWRRNWSPTGRCSLRSLSSENQEALKAIAGSVATLIATGERLFSRWDFKNLLASGTVDIIQPDLSHAGGISEVKKIAAMAECYDVAVAPIACLGRLLAACVQVDFCTPKCIYPGAEPWNPL